MEPQLNYRILLYQILLRRSSQGFTLVELLVVIVIMSILAAVAMPALLGQAAKARESAGKMGIGLVNRAQARYRTENDRFADSFGALAVGAGLNGNTTSVTETYTYELSTNNIITSTSIIAYPSNNADRSYSGGNLMYNNSVNEIVTVPKMCESDDPNVGLPPPVVFTATGIDCPSAYHEP